MPSHKERERKKGRDGPAKNGVASGEGCVEDGSSCWLQGRALARGNFQWNSDEKSEIEGGGGGKRKTGGNTARQSLKRTTASGIGIKYKIILCHILCLFPVI